MPTRAESYQVRRVSRRIAAATGVFLAAAFMLPAAGAGPASAGVVQKTKSTACSEADCGFYFGKVRKGKRLHIDNVACTVNIAGSKGLMAVLLAGSDGGKTDFFVPEQVGKTVTHEVYAFNQTTTFFAEAGQKPLIIAISNGDLLDELSCTISGEQVPAS